MDELAVTQIWMSGVIGMMIVFGLASFVGYVRPRAKKANTREHKSSEMNVMPPL